MPYDRRRIRIFNKQQNTNLEMLIYVKWRLRLVYRFDIKINTRTRKQRQQLWSRGTAAQRSERILQLNRWLSNIMIMDNYYDQSTYVKLVFE